MLCCKILLSHPHVFPPSFLRYTNLAISESILSPPPTLPPHPTTLHLIPSSFSPAQEDAVSSETEDSDSALKPALCFNLLHTEKKNERKAYGEGSGSKR